MACTVIQTVLFLSTLSLRRATVVDGHTVHITRFLSTLSLRRATPCHGRVHQGRDHFYPRSPCGERPLLLPVPTAWQIFLSTLSLRRATMQNVGNAYVIAFLSTLSLRRATNIPIFGRYYWIISIHALLAESDLTGDGCRDRQRQFLSTLSLRRATAKVHKTVGHFCAYGTNFMGIASSC